MALGVYRERVTNDSEISIYIGTRYHASTTPCIDAPPKTKITTVPNDCSKYFSSLTSKRARI